VRSFSASSSSSLAATHSLRVPVRCFVIACISLLDDPVVVGPEIDLARRLERWE
jgi:hypothetical protein